MYDPPKFHFGTIYEGYSVPCHIKYRKGQFNLACIN